MNKKPYHASMYCPISHMEEMVFFYEKNIDGTWYLEFVGCDHNYHKCEECATCKKEAYNKIINKTE